MNRRWSVSIARLALVGYVVVIAYLLLTPSPPRPSALSKAFGHFVLFLVLGLLVAWSLPTLRPVLRLRIVLLVGVVAGLASEALQAQIPNRLFEWSDIATNALGTIAAAFLAPAGPRDDRVAENDAPGGADDEGPVDQDGGAALHDAAEARHLERA